MPSSFQHLSLPVRLPLSACEKLTSVPELPKSLQVIYLDGCSNLQRFPESIEHLTKLNSLTLDECISLTSISDCSRLSSLSVLYFNDCSKLERVAEIPTNCEELYFRGCTSLFEMPSSFNHLNQLVRLSFGDCKSLTNIPDLGGLKSLEDLSIERCSKLKSLPELPSSIRRLYLEEIPIEELPPSFEHLHPLCELYLVDCSRLRPSLPNNFYSRRVDFFHNLNELKISGCGITEIRDGMDSLTSLKILELDGNNFEIIPKSIINLTELSFLDISHCEKLPWANVNAFNCTSLQEVSCPSVPNKFFALRSDRFVSATFFNCFNLDQKSLDNFAKDAQWEIQAQSTSSYVKYCANSPLSICYPSTKIPKWFDFRSNHSFIDVKLPLDGIGCNFLCFAVCVVVSPRDQDAHSYQIPCVICYNCILKSNEKSVKQNGVMTRFGFSGHFCPNDSMRSSHVLIGFVHHFFGELEDNEFLQIQFNFWEQSKINFELEKCGVYLMVSKYL